MKEKILIYQVLPRLFGNSKNVNKHNGTKDDNGVGKFSCFDEKALDEIKSMGFSHIWYTGICLLANKGIVPIGLIALLLLTGGLMDLLFSLLFLVVKFMAVLAVLGLLFH